MPEGQAPTRNTWLAEQGLAGEGGEFPLGSGSQQCY